ncbi:MAG: hypothetical protein WDA21_05715 [Bacilli bacterium]
MKRKQKILIISFLLLSGFTLLFGVPIAETAHQKILDMDLSQSSMETIVQAYDDLYTHIGIIANNARADMIEARQQGNRQAYREAYKRYTDLAAYAMSQAQTERLLERIMAEPDNKQLEYALWLYERSRYYRPTLRIDFVQSEEGFNYCYTQRIQQPPQTKIVLPDASQFRLNASKTGMLAGWGLTPDHIDYEPGQTIPMPLTDQTLYAIWTSAVQFFDPISQTEDLHQAVSLGDIIVVPQVTPPTSNYRFLGWYDQNTRTLVDQATSYEVVSKGAFFKGLWKNLTVEAISPLYYGFDRLPTDSQIKVGFSVSNQGNIPLRGLTATLSSSSPYVTILRDRLKLNDIPAGLYRTNNNRYATRSQTSISGEVNTFNFIITEAPSGTPIPLTISITDESGESWTSSVTFTVR